EGAEGARGGTRDSGRPAERAARLLRHDDDAARPVAPVREQPQCPSSRPAVDAPAGTRLEGPGDLRTERGRRAGAGWRLAGTSQGPARAAEARGGGAPQRLSNSDRHVGRTRSSREGAGYAGRG